MKRFGGWFIIIGLCALIVNCANRSASKQPEDFNLFYSKFNQDLDFQNSRIKYPISGKRHSLKNKNPDDYYLFTINDGIDFNNHMLDTNVYKIKREFAEGLVEETLYSPNSEFRLDYTFKLIQGRWFLTYMEDYFED